ncbi:MAG: HTTM domain-containing protein [Planctomycetes bacterium]|nr:HTTM domain-containing protein [Planctomycetota bacterium]
MPSSEPRSAEIVGIAPWLPWPFSAWSWWTEPVRAERLAALRIGVAACLIFDVAYNYAPETQAFFGRDGLGAPAVFDYQFKGPRTTWSLLRGASDHANLYLSLTCLIATTLWIVGTSLARWLLVFGNPQPPSDRTGIAAGLWIASLIFYTLSVWAQMLAARWFSPLAYGIPLVGFTLACLYAVFEFSTRLRDPTHRVPWVGTFLMVFTPTCLALIGLLLFCIESPEALDKDVWWFRVLQSWQEDDFLILLAMGFWITSAVLFLFGCATRFATIAAWMLSLSFQNANPWLDNAGDTIRLILLFYLMFCPCGAAWSIEALLHRRRGPVYVHPWPIRLLFVQMIFIYFINGLYKLLGERWLTGTSLYFVLADAALIRFSPVAFPIPVWMTRVMTWSVLAWEVAFPALVLFKWPRRLALAFGVLFHLGIFATMELGGFVPYALCLYLPLLPWERLTLRRERGEPLGLQNAT